MTAAGNWMLRLPAPARLAITVSSFFLILVARRYETLLHAQFIFEDGVQWYMGAWRLPPLVGMLTSYAGYLDLVP
jgi:hypothetical protein